MSEWLLEFLDRMLTGFLYTVGAVLALLFFALLGVRPW